MALLWSLQAEGTSSINGFLKGDLSNGVSIGYIKVGSVDAMSLTWRPNLKWGAWGLGIDVNIPTGNVRPDGYESVVFRHAEYDDGQKGLRYGVLDGITWGHGLLVKNYSTRVAGPLILNNSQTGLKGYYTFDKVQVQALGTWSHLYGGRVTERVHPLLTLGQGYISSATQAGIQLDAAVPLPLGFNGYAEYAQLMNNGQGSSIGVDWGFDALAFVTKFDMGYRMMSSRFAPGFFNAAYETDPTNLTSLGASSRNGYFAELTALAGSYLNLIALYESYQGNNTALTAQVDSKPREDVILSAYYKQPNFVDFTSLNFEQGAILGAKVGYKVNPITMMIAHYKKAYDPSVAKVVESQWYEVAFSF